MKVVLNETQYKKLREAGIDHHVVKTDVQSQLVWRDGPVLEAMRRGAVLLLDEVDQARTGIMALQHIAQGKAYYNKKTNEVIKPAPGFAIIATANTKGDGENSDMFTGAQIMNQAFLERFSVIIEQEYPTPKIEFEILKKYSANKKFLTKLVKIANKTRQGLNDGTLNQCLTTRRLVQIVKNYEIFGDEESAFMLAINRFNAETRSVFIEIYNSFATQPEAADNNKQSII